MNWDIVWPPDGAKDSLYMLYVLCYVMFLCAFAPTFHLLCLLPVIVCFPAIFGNHLLVSGQSNSLLSLWSRVSGLELQSFQHAGINLVFFLSLLEMSSLLFGLTCCCLSKLVFACLAFDTDACPDTCLIQFCIIHVVCSASEFSFSFSMTNISLFLIILYEALFLLYLKRTK